MAGGGEDGAGLTTERERKGRAKVDSKKEDSWNDDADMPQQDNAQDLTDDWESLCTESPHDAKPSNSLPLPPQLPVAPSPALSSSSSSSPSPSPSLPVSAEDRAVLDLTEDIDECEPANTAEQGDEHGHHTERQSLLDGMSDTEAVGFRGCRTELHIGYSCSLVLWCVFAEHITMFMCCIAHR